MGTYGYDDTNYKPPAAILKTIISTDIAKKIGKGEEQSKEVKMLIDTGADISIIPKTVVNELEELSGTKLPYDFLIVEGFDGNKSKGKLYKLKVLIKNSGFVEEQEYDLFEIDGEDGIIGRDILNNYLVSFNGPELKWTLGKT